MMRRQQINTIFKILFWSFYLPLLIAKHVYRLTGRVIGTVALVNRDSLQCAACGDEVSLVGRWECAWCAFVFDGFAFARCPGRNCGAVPPFIECQSCGLTISNPSLF
jgi:hypothetical protein